MKLFDYKDKRGESNGSGLVLTLTLIFVVLKFLHVINWSWWWVLCPIWLSLALGLVILLAIGLVTLIALIIKSL